MTGNDRHRNQCLIPGIRPSSAHTQAEEPLRWRRPAALRKETHERSGVLRFQVSEVFKGERRATLFSDTEGTEDQIQNVIGGGGACHLVERAQRVVEIHQ